MNRRTFLGRTTALAAAALAGCTSNGPGNEGGDTTGDDDGGDGGPGGNGSTGDNDTGSNGTGSEGGGTTTTEDGSGGAITLTDRAFERTGDCGRPGSATVTRDDDTIVVEGCIRGRNGCAVAVLDSARYDGSEDRLSVVVATKVEREGDEVCTQALVSRGYEVRIAFEGGTPGTVDVVHDGADGRTTVTSANATE